MSGRPIEGQINTTVSIIVSSYTVDRFGDLTELLDSVQSQTYDNIETILVTERSPELFHKIRAYVEEKGYRNIQILFNEGEWGAAAARNMGIRQATGNILAFVDDDAVLFPRWAEEIAKSYDEDDSIIGVTGPIIPLWQDEPRDWFPREFYWIFSCTYWDWTEKMEVRNGYLTNMSFKREAFDLCGLFEEALGAKGGGESGKHELVGEETEFSIRVKEETGKRIIYNPEVKVRHRVYSYRFTWKFITKRAYWEGYTKAMLNKSYGGRNKSENVLVTEHDLLRRILFKLIPTTLKLFTSKPLLALRKLWVTFIVLFCVAFGYYSFSLRNHLVARERAPNS